jgi:hypothetical protein
MPYLTSKPITEGTYLRHLPLEYRLYAGRRLEVWLELQD